MKAAAFLALPIFLFATIAGATEYRVCVLNFETPDAPQTSSVNDVFQNQSGVTLITMAKPVDFLHCVQQRYDEILIVAHAMLTEQNKDGSKPVDLGYFLNLEGQDRKNAIVAATAAIEQEIQALDPFNDSGKISRLQGQEREIKDISDSDPYYVVRPVLPESFILAREELKRQAASSGISLKKIRLESCLPHQVLAEYKDLLALIDENHIALDIAPKDDFWSFVEGMDVTTPDTDWMAESLRLQKSP